MKIFLTNLGKYIEGVLVGEWLELPATEEKIQSVLDSIGINGDYEEYFITDYAGFFGVKIGEYENIEELNKKAEILSNHDEGLISAITESNTDNIDVVCEILENESYIFYDGMTLEEVAEQIIYDCYNLPEFALRYFDFEAFARDLSFDGYYEAEAGVIFFE